VKIVLLVFGILFVLGGVLLELLGLVALPGNTDPQGAVVACIIGGLGFVLGIIMIVISSKMGDREAQLALSNLPAGSSSGGQSEFYGASGRNVQQAANLLVPPSILYSLPSIVRHELTTLPPHTLQAFLEEYYRQKKSTALAYLLWFFGFHYLYVGKWALFIIFFLTFGGMFFWWLIDIFRVPGIVGDYNKDVAVRALTSIRAIQYHARN